MEKLNLSIPNLSTAWCYDPVAMGKMRADTYNALVEPDPRMHCPKCLGKGLIACVREDGSMYMTDCSCRDARSILQRMDRSGLGRAVWDMTFRSFQATQDWQKQLLEGAKAYSRNPVGWFFIGGQAGCGKTHLCTAICRNQIAKGTPLEYVSWREAAARLKNYQLDEEQRQKELELLKTVQLLYIDDLFKTCHPEGGLARPTGADINLAFEILNQRYRNRLPTILSTQLQLHEILALDEALGSRIAELAGEHIYSVKPDRGRNYRLRNLAVV